MKVRSPTNVFLYRARLIFTLTALVPTVLTTVIGILLVAHGSPSVTVAGGILVLAFCATALTGYVLGTIFVTRGASLATVQNEFLASVSHELRTPLTSIRMFIDTLREGRVEDPNEKQRCLNVIHQELTRLDGLVAKLFTLSKIESPQAAFERRLVPVSEIIDEALAAFGAIRFGSEVDLQVKVDPGVQVYGDRAALAQAVANLLGNALKYTAPQGKRIEIEVTADAKCVFIAVTDNGRGVPRDEQEIIFEKFQRGSAASDGETVGTGLGLAVVRAIVKAHRGKVDVRSDGGHGSRFCITLPRRSAEPT